MVEAHGVGRDRLLEMLDADDPAACKLVYEIGRTLPERVAATNETVAEVIFRLENTAGRSEGGRRGAAPHLDVDAVRHQRTALSMPAPRPDHETRGCYELHTRPVFAAEPARCVVG